MIFRPEKDHATQLHSFHKLLQTYREYAGSVKLVLIGGSRNADDAARVNGLRELAQQLDIKVNSIFLVTMCIALFYSRIAWSSSLMRLTR